MSTVLIDEQRALVEAVRALAQRECGTREQRDALTHHGRHPHVPELYARIAELGWLGVAVPEAYGGSGGGLVDLCRFCEEITRGMVPIGAFGVTMIAAGAVERFGTDAQKEEVLRGIVEGKVCSIAMSEPGAGSDVAALRCRAERRGDRWVVDGHKTWISEAQFASNIVLVCRTGDRTPPTRKHEGLSMLLVPADHPGVEVRPIETMGGEVVNDVFFTDVELPEDRLIGTEGNGWGQLMAGLNLERLLLSAMILGTAQRAFDDTLAYVREREQFGRPIGSFQVLKHRIADLATELECARLLTYDVATKADANPGAMYPREASMAKLKTTETAKRIALEGMQMMGGYGYATEYDMEGHVRQALVSTIYGGTSEIQRDIIGRTYGLSGDPPA